MGTLALSAAIAGAGYVGGRVHAWTVMREAQAQLQVAIDEHERAFDNAKRKHQVDLAEMRAETDEVQKRRDQLAGLVALQEGLRLANRSLRELDRRNFGDAEASLRSAERNLSPQSTEQGVAEAEKKISGLNLVVAGNLSLQRQELSSIADMLDVVVEREREAFDETGPTEP